MYPKNAYSTHRFYFFVSQCFLLPSYGVRLCNQLAL
jgi:hypothetical protein